MKNLTEIVFILDRSGSMSGLESDTIGGFNSMLEKQKKETGDANVTTVLFDDQIEVIHDRFPIAAVEPMTDKDYYVRGSTALLDAVGSTVKKIENIQRRLPEDLRADKIIFIITTDGLENSSQEYSRNMVKNMIEKAQASGWQFIFMGANMDAVAEAGRMGIRASHAVSYRNDAGGVRQNFGSAGDIVSFLRSDKCDEAGLEAQIDKSFRAIRRHLKRGQ